MIGKLVQTITIRDTEEQSHDAVQEIGDQHAEAFEVSSKTSSKRRGRLAKRRIALAAKSAVERAAIEPVEAAAPKAVKP